MRILNVPHARPGETSRLVQVGGAAVRMSTTPCEGCAADCCRMRAVITVVDALRLAQGTGRRLSELVEATPHHVGERVDLAWPFKLKGQHTETRRHVYSLKRGPEGCLQIERADGKGRCGVYAHRPSLCRLFPFHLKDEHGELAAGNTGHCPTQWLQDPETRDGAAGDLARFRADQALDLQVVRFWNRGRRDRSLAVFEAWLTTTVLDQLPG